MEYRALSTEEFDDISSRILHEDNHLLIFNKRAGEIVQGDKTGDEALVETLKAFIAARDRKPGKVFLGVPHRLDRPVSGICVFAKTSKALERLNAMFREGRVHKTYWALCADGGVLGPGAGEEITQGIVIESGKGETKGAGEESGWTLLENALVRNEKQNKSYVAPAGAKNAKMARLKCRVLGSTRRYKLVEVELLTGRHHQIRCQLSHIGYTIKGDLKYGAPRSNPDGGICLMARRIRFEHPVNHSAVDVLAPLPSSWPIR